MLKLLWKLWIAVCLGALTCTPRVSAAGNIPSSDPSAVTPPIKFKHLTLKDGLSQSTVQTILQDKLGFIWFGTQDGLNRFNGYTFTAFRPDPKDPYSLTDRWINDMVEDPAGVIWIGTQGGGLNSYDYKTGRFTHYEHDSNNPDSLIGNDILTLLVDRTGTLWIGATEGLDRFDPEHNLFVHYQNDPSDPTSLVNNNIHAIYEDHDGTIWVGTGHGLDRLDRQTGTFTHISTEGSDGGLTYYNIQAIYQDSRGDLWVGTSYGLNRLSPGASKFEHFVPDANDPNSLSHTFVSAILEDKQGVLWIGTSNGLNRFDRDNQHFITYYREPGNSDSLTDATISSLYLDEEGLLWIGTFTGGVNILDQGKIKFTHYKNNPFDAASISPGGIFAISEDQQGYLWIGAYGSGLNRLDRATGEFLHYRNDPNNPDSLQNDFIYSVHVDLKGTVWVGTEMGLDELDVSTGKFTHYWHDPMDPLTLGSFTVLAVLTDSRGILWLGTRDGLDRFNRKNGQFIHYQQDPQNPTGISAGSVICLFETRQGDLWLGMLNSGLNRLDRETGQFENFRHNPDDPYSLSDDTVLAIHQDSQGALWLGTGNGLDKFDPDTGVEKRFTIDDGLPNNVIYAIVEDDQGGLWLSTNNGISHFDPYTEIFENFDEGDGLQSREFNMHSAIRTQDGTIAFGGVNGLNLFNPMNIQSNPYVPPVVLTSLTQGGQPFAANQTAETVEQITLRWPYNYFEFEFAALSYAESERNQYTYFLENFDTGWSPIGTRRFGRYTNLPGGDYKLHIKGSNNDGIWNETGVSIAVLVIPPIWQNWWFQASLVLLVVSVAYSGYQLRMRSIRNHNRKLEHQVMERTREIERLFEQTKELAVIEERNRLARDLHDSAKQKAFAALAQLGTARGVIQRDAKNAQSHVDEAENLVYEVIQELTFLIQEMYPLALEEKGLVTVLREYLYEWENRTEIQVNLKVAGERRLSLQIEQALYRIAQEGLANIARHSQATQVNINLDYSNGTVHMSVSDNGRGFDLAHKPPGVGLRSMQERAKMIKGQMKIEANPGQGTHIQINVPVTTPSPAPNGNNGGPNGPTKHHSNS